MAGEGRVEVGIRWCIWRAAIGLTYTSLLCPYCLSPSISARGWFTDTLMEEGVTLFICLGGTVSQRGSRAC